MYCTSKVREVVRGVCVTRKAASEHVTRKVASVRGTW